MSRLGQILLFIGMVFMILWFVTMRALSGNLMPIVWVMLGLGVACILGAIFKDLKFFIELSGQRTTKHGLNLGAMVVIVVTILVGLNFVAFRHVKKLDYTKEGLHSLSDQTKNILKSLDSDLEVKGYFADNQQNGAEEHQKFKDVTDLYATVSDKVKVTIINPVKNPEKAKTDNITASGTVVIKYKGRNNKFEDISEQGFTNAIIKITRDKNKVIYFVTGHGERDIESSEPTELGQFKKYLVDSSYDVKTLTFAEKQAVPDDSALLVIAGPKQAYFPPELNAVKEFLYKGGKLLLALDPGTKSNLGEITRMIGVEFKNNYILDPLGQLVGGGGATAVGMSYSGTSEITKNFKQNMTIFHLASQLKMSKDKPSGINTDEVVKSSPASFAKSEIHEGAVKFVEGKDEKGPLAIVISAAGKLNEEPGKGTSKEFQAVVAGDSDFMTNQLLDAQLNHDLALNTVAFLASDKELVSIRPKQAESSNIFMTQAQQAFLSWGLIVILPLMILFTGGTVWFRRRTA